MPLSTSPSRDRRSLRGRRSGAPSPTSARLAALAAAGRGGSPRVDYGWVPAAPGAAGSSAGPGTPPWSDAEVDDGFDDDPGAGGDEERAGDEVGREELGDTGFDDTAFGDTGFNAGFDDEADDGSGVVGREPGVRSVRRSERRGATREAGRSRVGRHRAVTSGPRVITLPESLRGARLDISWMAVASLVGVLLVATVVFAVRVAASRASAQPQAVSAVSAVTRSNLPTAFATSSTPASPTSRGVDAVTAAGAAAATTAAPPTASVVVVDVAGQVARPGVLRLPVGSRVVDALTRAGGAGPAADLSRLNLARVLVDGEQVFVPRPGEDPPQILGSGGGSASGSGRPGQSSGTATGPGGGPDGGSQVVDLNAADLAALDGLPGVGPVLAQRILDWRTAHGRFSTVDELGEVSGIGDKVLANLRPLVKV